MKLTEATGYVHAEMERNYVGSQANYWARLANIREMPHFGTRSAERMMLGFARLFPTLTARMLDRHIEGKGYAYVGAGTQHTVLRDRKYREIIKIHRRSVFMDEGERRDLRDRFRGDHRTLRDFMGGVILKQATDVNTNPLNPAHRAVVSRQRFVSPALPGLLHGAALFPAYRHAIEPRTLETLLEYWPDFSTKLLSFATNGLNLYDKREMAPDSSGPSNIVFVGQGENLDLCCLDGLPIREDEDPRGIQRVVDQLEDLKRYL